MGIILYGDGALGTLAQEILAHCGVSAKMYSTGNLPKCKDEYTVALACISSQPFIESQEILISLKYRCDLIFPVWEHILDAYPEVGIENGWVWKDSMIMDWETKKHIIESSFAESRSLSDYDDFLCWRMHRIDAKKPIGGKYFHRPKLESTLKDIYMRKIVTIYNSKGYVPFNLHAEGFELPSLFFSIKEIKEYRPEISVACYHSPDGAFRIPYYLIKNLEKYNFYFRYFAYMGQAAYFYAIPIEKEGDYDTKTTTGSKASKGIGARTSKTKKTGRKGQIKER